MLIDQGHVSRRITAGEEPEGTYFLNGFCRVAGKLARTHELMDIFRAVRLAFQNFITFLLMNQPFVVRSR